MPLRRKKYLFTPKFRIVEDYISDITIYYLQYREMFVWWDVQEKGGKTAEFYCYNDALKFLEKHIDDYFITYVKPKRKVITTFYLDNDGDLVKWRFFNDDHRV